MALINCPECEKEISDKTQACPHCGFPIPEQKQQDAKMVLDKYEISKEKEIPVNDQISKAPSFWSYLAAKILLCLVILSLCLSAFSMYTSVKASAIEQRVQEVENSSKFVEEDLILVRFSMEISEGVATNKAVIQKAVLYSFMPGEIEGNIDIRPQPTYSDKFLGQGDFDLSDRELKSMLEELMDKLVTFVGDRYNLKTISITTNNYAVAEYKDGVITLAGE
jgi:hypothetical protein